MLLLNLYLAVVLDDGDAWVATMTPIALIKLPNLRYWVHLAFLRLLRSWFDMHLGCKILKSNILCDTSIYKKNIFF